MVVGSSPVVVTETSDIAPVSSKRFIGIQATIECGFTLKRVRDMMRTYSSQMHRTDKCSQHHSNSGNYRVWIYSETRTWYDENI